MEIDERTDIFLTRPMKGEQPYVLTDAIYLKKCEGGRIVTTAPTIALGVHADARNLVLWNWNSTITLVDDEGRLGLRRS